MDAIECILARRSVRKFLSDRVPKEKLMEVVETALRSPSYKNSQPWELVIVSGPKKEELTNLLTALIEKNTPIAPDIPEPVLWPADIEERMKESARRRAEAMGHDRKAPAPDALKRAKLSNSRFYGAPHGLFFHQDASLSQWSIFDMGAFAQTLMLAANAKGLATVPQAYLCDYSSQVKDFLGIPAKNRLVLGMSIGYADLSDKGAAFRTIRRNADEMARWVE